MKILLSFILIVILKIIHAQNSETQGAKGWESICEILSCKPVLENCIRNNCLGKDNCRNCVLSENKICIRCVDGLWNEQNFAINGTQTIICDQVNNLHQTTCNFFCRMKNSLEWICEQIGGNPLCNCKSELMAQTTTTTTTRLPTTTTTTYTTTSKIPLGSLVGKKKRLRRKSYKNII
jgi:hypothetical protein